MNENDIISRIIGNEGGYVNNPADKGGPTRWGITQAVARAHGYTGDMASLPKETAIRILKADYWTGPRFDQIAAVSPAIAYELCDTGVNMGPSVPSKWLQEWLNGLNNQQKLYPDMTVDGNIGPRTISALKAYLSARGKAGEAQLIKALNCSQGVRYLELCKARPQNETFLYGWLERVSL